MSQKSKDTNPKGAAPVERQETGVFVVEKQSPVREPVITRNILMSPEKRVPRQETAIFVPDKRQPVKTARVERQETAIFVPEKLVSVREPVIKTTSKSGEKQETIFEGVKRVPDREPVIRTSGSPKKRVTRSSSTSRREESPETSVHRPSVIAVSPKVTRKRKPLVRQSQVEEDDSAPPTPSRTIARVIKDNTPKSGTD